MRVFNHLLSFVISSSFCLSILCFRTAISQEVLSVTHPNNIKAEAEAEAKDFLGSRHHRRNLRNPSHPTNNSHSNNSNDSEDDGKLNILALGGSATWGVRIKDRELAYPNVLAKMGGHFVSNVAMRATDAYYPSLCVESILEAARKDAGSDEDIEYDVVILEYSLNGTGGTNILLKRLMHRFPNAIFIYVHLYSLMLSIEDDQGRKANTYPKEKRNSVQWHWSKSTGKESTKVPKRISELFEEVGGYVYKLPSTKVTPYDVMSLFSFDWHHLSEAGHQKVASDLEFLLTKVVHDETRNKNKKEVVGMLDSKFGYGDSCVNWFATGDVTLKHEGGEVKQISAGEAYNTNKYSLEFTKKGSISIMNSLPVEVPLFLTYMSTNSIYPITNVTVGNTTKLINPHQENFHIAVTSQIGMAQPGYNEIIIEPIQWTNPNNPKNAPFRLVGVVLYGFHYHRNIPFPKVNNYIPQHTALALKNTDILQEDTIPYHILSLGGKVTWGLELEKEETSYPKRLGSLTNHIVNNKSIRATDAFYPSLCIQSMLESLDDDEDDFERNMDYDVILFEYSSHDQHILNTNDDIPGLRTLVKRLQFRYPNAILIYIHIYSLRDVIKNKDGQFASDMRDEFPDRSEAQEWQWAYNHAAIYRPPPSVKKIFDAANGYIFSMPVTETPYQAMSLFGPGMRSLSAIGHRVVADSLMKILEKAEFGAPIDHKHKQLDGSWGWGDECISWVGLGGVIPLSYTGGEVKDISGYYYCLEFRDSTAGTITVINNKNVATPLYFTYTVNIPDKMYNARITSNNQTVEIQPSKESLKNDIFATTEVGWVDPGPNTIKIEPLPGHTFQLIGVAMYGFHHHKGVPLKKMHNTINLKDPQDLKINIAE